MWYFCGAHRHKIRTCWRVLSAGFCVGLSSALPLYLYLGHDPTTGISLCM
ncbi:MAG: DUF2834 domain-containing protein [Gammaproteobacteria bacterium]|nr:DUF2834 domain-containing protein [Gammaproteobacteria bacterium]